MVPLLFNGLCIDASDLKSEPDHWREPFFWFDNPGCAHEQGRPHKRPVCPIVSIEKHRLKFARHGSYCLEGAFGPRKFLLLDPATTAFSRIRSIVKFVSENSWHSANDHYLVPKGPNFDPALLAEKLFFSTEPLGMHCGWTARLLASILVSRNVECRLIGIKGGGQAHIFLEAWLADEQRWIVLDPDFAMIPKTRGRPVSYVELRSAISDNMCSDIALDIVSNRQATKRLHHHRAISFGQIAWQPDFMKSKPMASINRILDLYRTAVDDIWYRNVVIAGADREGLPVISLGPRIDDSVDSDPIV